MIELRIVGTAEGGDGVAREPSGRVVFVRGAVPGDVVAVNLTHEKKRFARGAVSEVISPGPGRIDPLCVHVNQGCGGCDFQHVDLDRQRELKRVIVADAFERIGKFVSPEVSFGGGVSGHGYRTTVRCAVTGGSAGFRAHHSDERIATPECTIAHPQIRELMASGQFGPADEVMIRVGARTAESNVIPSPDATDVSVPGARVLGADALAAGDPMFLNEEMVGRKWRVSAQSFIQSSPDAAELLVDQVRNQLHDIAPGAAMCDLYAGIGLFAGSLGHDGPVHAVDGNPFAVADARHNLSDLDVTVELASIASWQPRPADVVIADPSRAGLGRDGVRVVAGTGATTAVLVSCDAAAGARDARMLVDAGFLLDALSFVDLFPQTSHVEVVAKFVRSGP